MDHHNGQPTATIQPSTEMTTGPTCLLLRDGRLFGPFPSAESARYWSVSQDLDGFSTYDLLSVLLSGN